MTNADRQKIINILYPFEIQDEERRVAYDQREWEVKQRFLKYYDEDGVHIWNSGQDCDGVRYGYTGFVTCKDYAGFLNAYDEAASWADGIFNWSIIPKSEVEEANKAEYHHDTFAEAAGY